MNGTRPPIAGRATHQRRAFLWRQRLHLARHAGKDDAVDAAVQSQVGEPQEGGLIDRPGVREGRRENREDPGKAQFISRLLP